jgi:hypothetical protein
MVDQGKAEPFAAIPFQRADLGAADDDAPLVFSCKGQSCGASHDAARRAVKMGFRNVSVMPGSIAPALDFQYMRTLAGAPYGGASPGEVLAVARTPAQAGRRLDAARSRLAVALLQGLADLGSWRSWRVAVTRPRGCRMVRSDGLQAGVRRRRRTRQHGCGWGRTTAPRSPPEPLVFLVRQSLQKSYTRLDSGAEGRLRVRC